MQERSSAQIAWLAWCDAHGNPASFRQWETLPEVVQAKWKAVADAVLNDAADRD